jgi:hypothetical protein
MAHSVSQILETERMGGMAKFRFQDLEIWKMAIELGDRLFDIADMPEVKHLYRFAEQVRGSGMSMSNNIAEGSGCPPTKSSHVFSILPEGRHLKMPIL